MKLIYSTRNEVYIGSYTYKNIEVEAVYKYSNDNDNEGKILTYLNDRDPSLAIPKLYTMSSNVLSPSGKHFQCLLIMEYIKQTTIFLTEHGVTLDKTIKVDWVNEIYPLILRLHKLGIIHGDLHFCNTLLKDGKWYLVDFGQAHSLIIDEFNIHKSHPGELFTELSDRFGILNTLGFFPNEWKKLSSEEVWNQIQHQFITK